MVKKLIGQVLLGSTFVLGTVGCVGWDDVILRHQEQVHNKLLVGLSESRENDEDRRKLRFEDYPLYEEVSYTKERIDKYFETTNRRQSTDELDEIYNEIESTKLGDR